MKPNVRSFYPLPNPKLPRLIFGAVLLLFGEFFIAVSSGRSAELPSITRELHWAVTPEKFELALERLRSSSKVRRRTPVVLSHGFFVNNLFLNLDEERSLARYLAEEGFDVWNLSLRGIGRSLNPLRGEPKSWGLDEMIDTDLSTVVRYIQKETGSPKIAWVGYDMGGLLLYGYAERKGGAGLAAGVAIAAPVTFHHPEQGPIKNLLKLQERPTLKNLFLRLNGPFLGRLLIPLIPQIGKLFYNPENLDDETQEKWLEEALAEINPGVLDHLLLMIEKEEFVAAKGNFNYRKNLARIRLPLLLIGGENDALAPPEAMRVVHQGIASADRTLRIFGPRARDSAAYGHVDLILGRKARTEVFPVIGKWLQQRDKSR